MGKKTDFTMEIIEIFLQSPYSRDFTDKKI